MRKAKAIYSQHAIARESATITCCGREAGKLKGKKKKGKVPGYPECRLLEGN